MLLGEGKMANDPEQQLYADMADLREAVPKLQNEVKSLKARLTKLTTRIEQMELMGFQDQVGAVDRKTDVLSEQMKEQQTLSEELIRSTVLIRLDIFSEGFLDILNSTNPQNAQSLRTQLMADIAKTRQIIRLESEPVAELNAFNKKWRDTLKKTGASFTTA